MTRNSRPDEVAARLNSEFEGLEQRLLEENPGVQAVMETYALTQAAVNQFDKYMQVLNVRPATRTSNGSA